MIYASTDITQSDRHSDSEENSIIESKGEELRSRGEEKTFTLLNI